MSLVVLLGRSTEHSWDLSAAHSSLWLEGCQSSSSLVSAKNISVPLNSWLFLLYFCHPSRVFTPVPKHLLTSVNCDNLTYGVESAVSRIKA